MKTIFLFVAMYLHCNVNCQVNDSLQMTMEEAQISSDIFAGKLSGKELPKFTAHDLNESTFTRASITNGKVTFLNFWYLSCAPCIAEIPSLNRLYDLTKGNPNVQFFAITWESEIRVKEAIKKYDIRFPVLMTSPKDIRGLTFERGYPVNMVLDKKGRVYTFFSGGSGNSGREFELYWKNQIDKIEGGDTAVVPLPDSESIQYIDSPTIRSFGDVANYFKGQSVYIDIWGTWCVPCRKEFDTKNNMLDSFLRTHRIERLYISINNPSSKQIWKTVVSEFQPLGYHLLAGPELFIEIKEKIYKKDDPITDHKHVILKDGKLLEVPDPHVTDSLKLIRQLRERF